LLIAHYYREVIYENPRTKLSPVGVESLYSTVLGCAASKFGRQLWEQFGVFGELRVNCRFKDTDETLTKLAAKAHVGDVCSRKDKELRGKLNSAWYPHP